MDEPLSVMMSRWKNATASAVRQAIRSCMITGPTAGMASGYVQANLVVIPEAEAEAFAEFCRLNPRPCPLLTQTEPGDPQPNEVALGADLRTDVPRYRIFRDGVAQEQQRTDIVSLWDEEDSVGFLIGCSFTFENALVEAGLPVRHLELGRNVPMYRTNVACRPAGKFAGPMVVSMRPFRADQVDQVVAITGQFEAMHGAPVHVGDPSVLGIARIDKPDFGDAVPINDDEIPVFWACGVTPQLALAQAKLPLAITHSPGCMFITDRKDADYRVMVPRASNSDEHEMSQN